jgi:hypothetical protein
MRHLISRIDCAIAGAAIVAAPATPMPVTLIKSRRFIALFLLWGVVPAFVSRLTRSMEHPVRDFHDELKGRDAKSPALAKAGLASTT